MAQETNNLNSLPPLSPYAADLRGFPVLNLNIITEETMDDLMNYVPWDGDTVVSSSMKTGSTWFCNIITQILTRGRPFHDSVLNSIAPYTGMITTEEIDKIRNPRFYRHHMPYHMVKRNDKAKYLYIYRNPNDTLVSAYHFLDQLCDEPFRFEDLFEDFLNGDSYPYGSYFEHILSYTSHKEDRNLFITSYERIQQNKQKEVLRIAKFLGEEYYRDITSDNEFMKRVMNHTDFQYMKANLKLAFKDSVKFFRKGIVGDGDLTLNLEQKDRVRKVAEQYLKGTEIYNEWYPSSKTDASV